MVQRFNLATGIQGTEEEVLAFRVELCFRERLVHQRIPPQWGNLAGFAQGVLQDRAMLETRAGCQAGMSGPIVDLDLVRKPVHSNFPSGMTTANF
jgi:hypothetical protein